MKAIENRIPPPAVMIIFAIAMWCVAQVSPTITIHSGLKWLLVVGIFTTGLVIGIAGIRTFNRAKTTINPLKPEAASNLVSSGIFQYTRNPMYISLTLALCSWATFLQAPWTLAIIILFIAYITRFQIIPEERAMLVLFGEEFKTYKANVRRWI